MTPMYPCRCRSNRSRFWAAKNPATPGPAVNAIATIQLGFQGFSNRCGFSSRMDGTNRSVSVGSSLSITIPITNLSPFTFPPTIITTKRNPSMQRAREMIHSPCSSILRKLSRPNYPIRSMIVQVACPWPMHITCRPSERLCCSIALHIFAIRPAPVAPSG
jgi:hypothetical protein